MRSSGLLALLLSVGCLAPDALSVGAYVSPGTSSSGSSTTSGAASSSGEGDTTGEAPPFGYDGNVCMTASECVASFPCQTARCLEERCIIEFDHAQCDDGLVCTLGGCAPPSEACEDRYEGVLVCDDFEQGISPQWTSVTAITDASFAYQGSTSVRASASPGDQSMLRYLFDVPRTDGMLAVRTYVWVDGSSVVGPWVVHYELMQIPSHPDMRLSLDLRADDGLMVVNSVSGIIEDGPGLLTPEEWHCLELRVGIDDVAGTAELWMDGEQVLVEQELSDTLPEEGYGRIGLGVLLPADGAGPVELFIDDAVVATAPIGCD